MQVNCRYSRGEKYYMDNTSIIRRYIRISRYIYLLQSNDDIFFNTHAKEIHFEDRKDIQKKLYNIQYKALSEKYFSSPSFHIYIHSGLTEIPAFREIYQCSNESNFVSACEVFKTFACFLLHKN